MVGMFGLRFRRMAEFPGTQAASPPGARDRGPRLDSWKEIAAYLQKDVRTLQRWEKTAGLPVRRMQKPGLRAVYAYTADLDEWLRDGPWALGEAFTMADCAAAPALFYAEKVLAFGRNERLARYLARLVERPSFARVLEEAKPYFAKAYALLKPLAESDHIPPERIERLRTLGGVAAK